MRNVVGPRIKEARRQKGGRITQEQLAARLQAQGLDIDRSAISRIELGQRLITDVEIIAICEALGIEIAWLFKESAK